MVMWLRHRRMPVLSALVVAVAVVTLGLVKVAAGVEASAATRSSTGCPKLVLYFSRGSGESAFGPGRGLGAPGFKLFMALATEYGAHNVGEMANGYPAVRVTVRILGVKVIDVISLPRYRSSVTNGVRSATRNIADVTVLCPGSLMILGGYSQGAQVTREVLAELDNQERRRIAAVVLFGDPYFNPKERDVHYFPGGERERRGVMLRLPRARAIPISTMYAGRVFSWCHPFDVVCEGPIHGRKDRHSNYEADVAPTVEELAAPLAAVGIKPELYRHAVIGICDDCALVEFNGPGAAGHDRVGAVDEHAHVEVECQTHGQSVTGQNGRKSSIWDKLPGRAFVPDYYVNTPSVGIESRPIPPCLPFQVHTP